MNAVVFACLVVLLCLDAVTVECVTLKSTFSSSNKTTSRHHSKRSTSGSRLTYEERLDFLKAHNEYRRNVKPPASDMQFIVWHEELASMAQEWADRCKFEHGNPSGHIMAFHSIGQNLYLSSGQNVTGQSVAKSWLSEGADYDYNSNECASGKTCGHYTQLVWAKSNHLGCAMSRCDRMIGIKFKHATFVVCNYGPAGNVNRRRPYTEGKACSACPQGTTCNAGLCASNPKCGRKVCLNGGTLHYESCECACVPPYHGATCGTESKHTGGGHVITPVNWLQGVTCVLTLNTIIKVY